METVDCLIEQYKQQSYNQKQAGTEVKTSEQM
jgi:hypothetical protein